MQFSAINHDILHSLFLENHLKLLEIAHTSYLLGRWCLVWVLAFHFVCKWASQKVRKMSSGTTWGKNWVGMSLARGWCCERTSVNRQLTQENRPRSRRRKKREREDKNSRVKVPRQSGPPMLQLLAPICSGQNAQWLSNQGTRSLWHTPWLGRGPSKGFLNKQITGVGGMGGALAAPDSALCHDSKKTLQDASLIFSYLKTVSAPRHVTYRVLAGPDTPPWPIEVVPVPGLTLTLHSASIINTDTLSH